jgi:hypothetical protein
MILKDGKFWDNGKVVPIEFGNKEQIRLMTYALDELKALETDGIEIDPDFEEMIVASYQFKCICGSWVRFSEVEADDKLDAIAKFIGQKRSCKCKKKYKIEQSEDGEIVIKYDKK